MIEKGIWLYLAQDATVTALTSTRIYRDTILPKGYSLPAINYFQVHGESIESLDGDDLTEIKRFQFSCRATTQDVATSLRNAVRALLVPKVGGSVNYTLPDGTYVQAACLHDERDLPSEEGPGESIRHSMIEVEFTYE